MLFVFVVKHEDFQPSGIGIVMCESQSHTFGTITPIPFRPDEVLHTLIFQHEVDAKKFVQNPVFTPLQGWFCRVRYSENVIDSLACRCQYNLLDDPAMDSCIHCHLPYERK